MTYITIFDVYDIVLACKNMDLFSEFGNKRANNIKENFRLHKPQYFTTQPKKLKMARHSVKL